jgi:hypothetical protein
MWIKCFALSLLSFSGAVHRISPNFIFCDIPLIMFTFFYCFKFKICLGVMRPVLCDKRYRMVSIISISANNRLSPWFRLFWKGSLRLLEILRCIAVRTRAATEHWPETSKWRSRHSCNSVHHIWHAVPSALRHTTKWSIPRRISVEKCFYVVVDCNMRALCPHIITTVPLQGVFSLALRPNAGHGLIREVF